MTKEQAIEIIEKIKEGSQDCLNVELWQEKINQEEVEHWKNEVEAIETLLNLIQEQQAEIEKKENRIEELKKELDKLKLIAGLALRGRPLEISREAFNQLENTIEIEQTENMMNDSFIFRAR